MVCVSQIQLDTPTLFPLPMKGFFEGVLGKILPPPKQAD
jgi:hypothetical protein